VSPSRTDKTTNNVAGQHAVVAQLTAVAAAHVMIAIARDRDTS
jgi:hypothetical protein